MAPGIALSPSHSTQVNGTSKPLHPGRSMADWGSPLPTRKLAPHEDVRFDSALKPRAHHMAGISTFPGFVKPFLLTNLYIRNIVRLQDIVPQCSNVGFKLLKTV
jgi:hypothetical protein